MTNAQTEARAIARCVRGCATDDQYIELVERIAAALAAKDAELAAKHEAYCIAHDQAMENGQALQRAEAQLAEANKMLATDDDARRSLKYWIDGTEIIEGCLKKARYAKPEEAPFGMDRAEAQIWHQAQESAYQHALEMMGVPTASGPMIRAAARRAREAQGGE